MANTDVVDGETKTVTKMKKPSMWKVIILNDDYTPVDYVTIILVNYFDKTVEEASKLTMDVHRKGSAVAGVYTFEVAETKVNVVAELSKQNELPLRLIVEPNE